MNRGRLRWMWTLMICVLYGSTAQASGSFSSRWLQKENPDVRTGNAHLVGGEPEKALARYTQAAKAFPDEGRIHVNRGLALMRQDESKLDEAMQALTLAVASDVPDAVLARVHFNLGNAFFYKEDYAEAISQYRRSLLLKPGNRDVAWNLELAMQKKQEQDDARKQQEEEEDREEEEGGEKEENGDSDESERGDDSGEKSDSPESGAEDDGDAEDAPEEEDDADREEEDDADESDVGDDDAEQESQDTSTETAAPQLLDPGEMEQVLQALDNEDQGLHRERARRRGMSNPAADRDW